MFYLNVDLYRYYIGREDQSVNEQVMIRRIDWNLKVNYHMVDTKIGDEDVTNQADKQLIAWFWTSLFFLSYLRISLYMIQYDRHIFAKPMESNYL